MQDKIISKVEEIGFEAEVIGSASADKSVFSIPNMTSSVCSDKVEAALTKKSGVIHANVNHLTQEAEVGRWHVYSSSHWLLRWSSIQILLG